MEKNNTLTIVIIVLLLIVGVAVLAQNDTVKKLFDPCERTFSDCNHNCGEGILNSICKEKCTYDYRVCEDK